MIYATFLMEQHLGHQVHYQNLRQFIDHTDQIHPTWVPITYAGENGFWGRFILNSGNICGSLIGRRQVQRGLKVEPCDVLYFNTQVPAALQSPRAKGRPYIISTDITPIQYDQLAIPYGHHPDRKGPLRWIKHQVTTHVFYGAARLLPWSSWTAQSLADDYGLEPEQIEVLPVGVDLEYWRPARHSSKKTVRILFVGGDFVRKGGCLLLEAFRSLPAGSAELILVTRTAVPQEAGVTVYNKIQPNSTELTSLYQKSDIFVLPTTAEAFGISAVEASASALPVIATSTGGLPDIVADQQTGFLIPVGDIGSLAARLRLLVEDAPLRKQMGQAAYRRAQSRFDARKNAARLVEILVQTVSGRGSR